MFYITSGRQILTDKFSHKEEKVQLYTRVVPLIRGLFAVYYNQKTYLIQMFKNYFCIIQK